MSSQNQSYSLAILNEHAFPAGFAGTKASFIAARRDSPREIKVIVSSPSKISESRVVKFAKKVTKHLRTRQGWSAFNVNVQSMETQQLPRLGTPQQVEGDVAAWIVE
jgi:hypothetical protein